MLRDLALLACLLSASCMTNKNKQDDYSSINIVGGRKVSLDSHPWTLKITFADDPENFCTATFVSHNTMLTAAHCVDEHPVLTLPELGGVKSETIHQYPRHRTHGIIDTNDLALIVFPDNTGKKFARITTQSPKKGDTVTLLGYGSCTKVLGPKDTFGRCIGTNVIDSIAPDTRIVTINKGGVVLSKGDSGGPLFIEENRIVGVANSIETTKKGEQSFFHTNLTTPDNLNWLRSVVASTSARICGLDGEDCGLSGGGGSPPKAPNLEARARRLASDFVTTLNSESRDCRFELEDSVELVEDDKRFEFTVGFHSSRDDQDRQTNLNVSLTEFSKGSEIFTKTKAWGRLGATFIGCSFR